MEGHYLFISSDIWENEIKGFDSVKTQLNWPTPIAAGPNNYSLTKPIGSKNRNSNRNRNRNRNRNTDNLVRCLYWESGFYGTHYPNPRWFEQMMGLPIGWTDPYL